MRVTFVNRLAGIFWGGGETFDLETARALHRLGHEVSFVVGRRWSRLDVRLDEFPTVYVPTPYLRWIAYRGETSRSRLIRAATSHALPLDRSLFERAALRAILDRRLDRDTDVFQLSAMPRLGAWLRERTGRKAVLVWHGPPGARHREWSARCSGTFSFGASLEAVRKNVDPTAEEIPPGVDTKTFSPGDGGTGPSDRTRLRALHRLADDAVVFAFVGRMIPVKNLPLLLEAFGAAASQDPRPVLALFGDGPMRRELLSEVAKRGLQERVLAPGWVEREDLVAHYRMSDALVLSSSFESFSLVAMEAMACALPVVATRAGWLPRLVSDDVEGVLVDAGAAGELAAALLRLTRNAEERRAMGCRGREKALAQFDWQRTAARMIDLYNRVDGAA